jgi:hypothetical protein
MWAGPSEQDSSHAGPKIAKLRRKRGAHVDAYAGRRFSRSVLPLSREVYQSCARWRRSQLPFASSHSSNERTLARAKAIAQSAAP